MDATNCRCANCGGPIADEPPGGDPGQRKPCPECGSVARSFSHVATGGIQFSGTLSVEFVTYEDRLLADALNLIIEGKFSIAVVVAHMACEISVERALAKAIDAKSISYLDEFFGDALPGYNLANPRVRKLYNAVTGGDVQNQPFWQAFKESATRRNQAVHRGAIITKDEAEASHKAATELVAFLRI